MASTFQLTGTFTNLTRLELEQLRRADATGSGKALTVGDSGLLPEGVAGLGNVNAEPFWTQPNVLLDQVPYLLPPPAPGTLLGTVTQTWDIPSESAQWYGPDRIIDGTDGYATDASHWRDDTPGLNFTLMVQSNDLLLIRCLSGSTGDNRWSVGVVTGVAANVLTISSVSGYFIGGGGYPELSPDGEVYSYIVVRPSAAQLFAVPGSGPLGQEQAFMAVTPGSPINLVVNPSISSINSDRVRDLIAPHYGSGDRADAIYKNYASNETLDHLGYRFILYPCKSDGSGPDLTKPILTPSPVIDPAIPMGDQRMTIDYKAGILRFSCAPAVGGQIKPFSGCVNATTGRLQLYAVYWAIDTSMTSRAAAQLWATRGTEDASRTPAKVFYDPSVNAWKLGSTLGVHDFFVSARTISEDFPGVTKFGTHDPFGPITTERAFVYWQGRDEWTFSKTSKASPLDPSWSIEMNIADKTAVTVGDISAPPMAQADVNPSASLIDRGGRTTEDTLAAGLYEAMGRGYGTLHLRKGLFSANKPLVVPPGVTIEGEGPATRIISNRLTSGLENATQPVFRFGPNTYWGVYDTRADDNYVDGLGVIPETFEFTPANPDQRIEGMDVVWNPVRRVWAVVYADVTSNAIWFNEVGASGHKRFSGLGIDIKNSADVLYTKDYPGVGTEHTPGHYPRIAHHQWTDEYSVVWVISGPGFGPNVQFQTFNVNVPLVWNEAPTVTLKFASPETLTGPNSYSDHPSVAVDNSQNGIVTYYTVAVSYWSYEDDLSLSKCSRATTSMGGTLVWSYDAGPNDPLAIISSTDVSADGVGGFLTTWSRRDHMLILGVHGKISTPNGSITSDLSDTGFPAGTFAARGVVGGSKFLYLGLPRESTWVWDSSVFLRDILDVSAYGIDGTVMQLSGMTTVRIKTSVMYPFGASTPWRITLGANGTGNGTATLTDATKDFSALGVQVGDVVHKTAEIGGGTYRGCVVTAVAPGGDVTKLSLDRNLSAGASPFNYGVYVGREFRWAIAPRSEILVVRNYSGYGETAEVTVVGGKSPTNYRIDQYEPDLVRLSRGEDKWLLVYQAFNTTALLAGKSIRNFDDGYSAAYADTGEGFAVGDHLYPYREHVSTCSLLLNDDGTSSVPNNAELELSSQLPGRMSRDIEISHRSLGTRDPITQKPNYFMGRETTTGTPYSRMGQHMAREVSAINFMYRWAENQGVGLIPDVTWSGSDWTVVSPSKAQIHSYTGTYIVTGGGTIFGDPTFYFGGGAVDLAAGTNFLRRTVAVGDRIYFPAIGLSALITQIRSEHVITLDSNPFGYGLGTTTGVEWVLMRDDVISLGALAAGIKNPGFRVSASGDVIVSSHYTTFADPVPAEKYYYPNRSEIMRRVNEDSFQRSTSISDGWNIPGSRREDGIEQQSRYVGDVGFRGVAVGEPKPFSRRVLDEDPCCAICWGDNLYGFVDRYKAETLNEVRFYRQSFGPYNNCIRNLAIEGTTVQPSPSTSLSTLKVLTRNHVYTRHGGPTCSMGNFATDGYRNCFVYQDWRVARGYLNAQEFVLRAVYTDAFGGNPVMIEGPRPQLHISTTPTYRWPAYGGLDDIHMEAAANPFAPKVIWDGTRFVAAWVEGGGGSGSAVCLGVFPGDENRGLQTSEMLDPLDILTEMQTAQAVQVDYRDQSAGSYHLTTLDIAYSGKVYAVLWADGLDKGTAANPGAALGVTLFDAVEFAGGLDSGLELLDCSSGGAANGVTNGSTTFTAAGATLQTNGVRPFDILRIREGAGTGTYRIITVVSETELTLDRVAPTAANQVWTVHRRLMPAAGRTYVIGVASGYAHGTSGEPRDAYVNPHIVWDGKQFVAVWRGKQWDGPNQQDAQAIQKHLIPENGLGQAAQIVKMGAPDQWTTSTNGDAGNLATLGIGFVEGLNPNAVWIRLTGTAWGIWGPGRTPQAPVRPGDILVISSVFLRTGPGPLGSYTHDHDGWYRITEYNPTLGAVRLFSHQFDSSSFNSGEMVVFGAILSAGVGAQSQMYSRTDSFTGTGQNLQDAPGGFGANASILTGNDWAGVIEAMLNPNAVYGFVYNEKWDEYALLYEGENDLALTKFRRGIAGMHTNALVTGTSVRAAALGWNGEHYLVVYATTQLNWKLYSRDLGLEDSGVIAPALLSGGTQDIAGAEIWQQPGPVCYGGHKPGSDVQPQWRSLHVEWNPRLNRWTLSASVLWYANETVPGIADSYELNNRLWIQGLIDSWVGRTLHFTAPAAGYIAQYAQPGCKLMLTDSGGAQNMAIYTILDSDDAARTITVDTVPVSGVTPIDPTAATHVYVLPREDVWCFTLGYDTPAVQFLDADGSSLENVILSGSPVDIEERYNNMARPIWQSGGPPVGAYYADILASMPLLQGIQRSSQYSTRLLVPTMKVELPRFTNVRSRTKIKYGQGLTPGEPSTDRYTFGERNRRG